VGTQQGQRDRDRVVEASGVEGAVVATLGVDRIRERV
tara:strand:- start:210 stop:320 length:111 start_codon:yes stop_codon:yes gene_type:complete